MGYDLSQTQIGNRIAALRKRKGLSQADLAKSVKISRPSLAQIELGNRGVDLLEMKQFSIVLGFSLDEFLTKDFSIIEDLEVQYENKSTIVIERISSAPLNIQKFKNILLYILERCAGKPNIGESVLYKLLYFSDFNYYELYEELLTGAKYRKLPNGPVPEKFERVVLQMLEDGQLQRVKAKYLGALLIRYLPLIKADLTKLKASEKEVIDNVIVQLSDWEDASITNYVHKDMPWVASKEGQELNYELVFYREAPFSVRNYGSEIASK